MDGLEQEHNSIEENQQKGGVEKVMKKTRGRILRQNGNE
jgi:hypothetical protein